MKSYLLFWKAALDKKWRKSMIDLYSWVESSSKVCVVARLTWSSKKDHAFELDAGRKFCIIPVLFLSLKCQQNKEIPGPESWLSAEVWICFFRPFPVQPSVLLSLGCVMTKPQLCRVHREQSCGQTWLPVGDPVSDLAFVGFSFPDYPLLLWKRYRTHPEPSHIALANLDLDRWSAPVDLCYKHCLLPAPVLSFLPW